MNPPLPCGAVAPMEMVSRSEKSVTAGSFVWQLGHFLFITRRQMGRLDVFTYPGDSRTRYPSANDSSGIHLSGSFQPIQDAPG